jgi:hypothetical protein
MLPFPQSMPWPLVLFVSVPPLAVRLLVCAAEVLVVVVVGAWMPFVAVTVAGVVVAAVALTRVWASAPRRPRLWLAWQEVLRISDARVEARANHVAADFVRPRPSSGVLVKVFWPAMRRRFAAPQEHDIAVEQSVRQIARALNDVSLGEG